MIFGKESKSKELLMPESDMDLFRRALQRCFIPWHERDLADVTHPGGQECLGDQ